MNRKEIMKTIGILAENSEGYKALYSELNHINRQDKNLILSYWESQNFRNKDDLIKHIGRL